MPNQEGTDLRTRLNPPHDRVLLAAGLRAGLAIARPRTELDVQLLAIGAAALAADIPETITSLLSTHE